MTERIHGSGPGLSWCSPPAPWPARGLWLAVSPRSRRPAPPAASPAPRWPRPGPQPRPRTGAAAAQQLLAQSGTPAAPKNLSIVGGRQLASPAVVNYPSASHAAVPNVQAAAYVIADASTGQVLAARDPHGQLAPASTLKMLTAATLIPLLNPSAYITAVHAGDPSSRTSPGWWPGPATRCPTCSDALLLISANDAADRAGPGHRVAEQRRRPDERRSPPPARPGTPWPRIPNGLDAPGQHVSAYDLALIARQALKLPAFLQYDQTRTFELQGQARPRTSPGQPELAAVHLSRRPRRQDRLDLGGEAHLRGAGQAERGHADRDPAALPALTEVNYAKSLLNWGFATDGKVTPVGQLINPLPVKTTPKTPTIQIRQGRRPAGDRGRPDRQPRSRAGWPRASIALIVCAAAAAIVLMLLRRRTPTRTGSQARDLRPDAPRPPHSYPYAASARSDLP